MSKLNITETTSLALFFDTINACNNFVSPNPIYAPLNTPVGPNVGDYLYQTPGNPPTNPVSNGYYSNGTFAYLVTGVAGQITSSVPC